MIPKKEVVEEHETRRMIFNHIQSYPGVSYQLLKSIYGLSDGTLRYHLKYLEKGDKVQSKLENGKRHFYPNGYANMITQMSEELLEKHKLTQIQIQILNTIKRYPEINQKDLIRKTGLKRFVITYNLKRMIDMGFVRKYNHRRNVCYEYITDKLLRFEMLKILSIKLLNKEIDEQTFLNLKSKLGL